ncbi:hypothetical protein N7478_011698 [Penicillium angulare]|uniref:uncharacterized protein n=1 Tax=Penicillium angulare TaxID=116970 RepID=UPI00253FABA1|nr:uncharacterized protein N7478_011698 [Penicillium angulare]KAJ5261103.1 hypothetical protein N7478_011698 [Penicillium angulare]
MTETQSWRPKVIIFDLLTALLDSWTLWDASTPSGTATQGRPWRARYLEVTFGQGTYVPYEQLVHQAANDVGLPDSAPTKLLENWINLQPWPEVPRVLKQLRLQGYMLGVVTNCSIYLGRLACSRAGQFDAVVTAGESGFYKPAREAYQAILTAMDVEAEDVLFVAGSAGDVEGATNVGMKVVWHNRVGLAKKGDAVPLKEGRITLRSISAVLVSIGTDLGRLSSNEQELITSITSGGALVVAVTTGFTCDKFGRKLGIYFACVLFLIGTIIQAAAFSLAQMSVGRLLVGLVVGIAAMVFRLHIAELAPARYRGWMIVAENLCVAGGQFIEYAIGAGLTDAPNGWR